MNGLRSAIGFLTILPVAPQTGARGLSSARPWFPVVGLALGSILAAIDLAMTSGYPVISDDAGPLPPLLVASILIVTLVTLTRALHLDGFMDCCDALLGGFERARRLEVLRDPHVGAFAVAGVVCLLLLKVAAVMALPPHVRLSVLIVFPCASRWAVLITMERFPYVRRQGIGTPFFRREGRWQRFTALILTVIFSGAVAGLIGIGMTIVAGAVAWGFGAWATKLLGGVTGDVYGATIELVELSVLVSAVLLAQGLFPTASYPLGGLLS